VCWAQNCNSWQGSKQPTMDAGASRFGLLDHEEHPAYRSATLSAIGVKHIYSSQDYYCALTVKNHLRCWARNDAYVPLPHWNLTKIAQLGIDKEDDDNSLQVTSFATGLAGSRSGRMLALLKDRAGQTDGTCGKLIQWGNYMNQEWNTLPKQFYSCENPFDHYHGNNGTGCEGK